MPATCELCGRSTPGCGCDDDPRKRELARATGLAIRRHEASRRQLRRGLAIAGILPLAALGALELCRMAGALGAFMLASLAMVGFMVSIYGASSLIIGTRGVRAARRELRALRARGELPPARLIASPSATARRRAGP